MVVTAVLLALVLVASVTDVRRRRIYNWTTYPGILAALGLSAAGWLAIATTGLTEGQLEKLGWIPPDQSLLGLLVCGGVMLVCFVMFQIGAGDLKLIAMLGAFLGPEEGLIAMLWTLVLGGCLGLIALVWRMGALRLLALAGRQIAWTLRLGRWPPLNEEERAQLKVPLFLAPCALAAVAMVRLLPRGYVT